MEVNTNYASLAESYLFANIAHKVAAYKAANPDADIIRMGIGDVTRPLTPAVIRALHSAVNEMGEAETFRGYGPEQGYDFLRSAIVQHDYEPRGVKMDADEVFISDGAKSDLGNIGDILSTDCVMAVPDPVYPVYVDTNIMAGRKIVLLPCTAENGFVPQLPTEHVDVIYLCSPNNPTGVALTKSQLQTWVDFALAHEALILFDSAYEAYIESDDVPHSIYECSGAKRCAIEFRSFSKTAGFTGLRCGYTIVPKTLCVKGAESNMLNRYWVRRQTTKFNGVPYIVQRAAEAVLSPEGWDEQMANVNIYKQNAKLLKSAFEQKGLMAFGGDHSPYVWVRTPNAMSSWEYFDLLLDRYHLVVTPGAGFGTCGEGWIRLTGFASPESTRAAIERLTLS